MAKGNTHSASGALEEGEGLHSKTEALWTVEDVARLLRVKKSTIYSLVHRGVIPHMKITGKILRFEKSKVAVWLAEKSAASRSRFRGKSERPKRNQNPLNGKNHLQEVISRAKKEVLATEEA